MLARAKYVEMPHANGLKVVVFSEQVGTQFVFGHGVRAERFANGVFHLVHPDDTP